MYSTPVPPSRLGYGAGGRPAPYGYAPNAGGYRPMQGSALAGRPLAAPSPGMGGGTPGGALSSAQMTQQQITSLKAAGRDRWARAFGGNPFLDIGLRNRLVMSIRSGVPAEMDFALDRLVQISANDAETVLRFGDFPGLLDGLVSLVQNFVEVVTAPEVARSPELWPGPRVQNAQRRAAEAALVLRNVATEKHNAKQTTQHRALLLVLIDLIELVGAEGTIAEMTTEILLSVLEVFEVVAPTVVLKLPSVAKADKPSTSFYPLLTGLTRSRDRALILEAFRCLSALASNNASEIVFALPSHERYEPPIKYPHPYETAIQMLAIRDAELSIAALDFLYMHTLIPYNAIAFAARPDLTSILRLVCSKIHMGASKEVLSIDVPLPGQTEAWQVWRAQPPRHYARLSSTASSLIKKKTAAEVRIDPAVVQELAQKKEPERGTEWLKLVFEAAPDVELPQVDLWTAYRTTFEPLLAGVPADSPLVLGTAGEVIKLSQEVFKASPMVVDPGPRQRFVIKGIRVREDLSKSGALACEWQGCALVSGLESPQSLYDHIKDVHFSPEEPPSRCCWAHCNYQPAASDPENVAASVLVHARTHIPTLAKTTLNVSDKNVLIDPPVKAVHERFHDVTDDQGEISGTGLLASLVLRNISRVVRTALGKSSSTSSVKALSEGERSIFEAFQAAAEGGKQSKDPIAALLEKVDYTPARDGAHAFIALADDLLKLSVESHLLGRLLGEAMETVTLAQKMQPLAPQLQLDGAS